MFVLVSATAIEAAEGGGAHGSDTIFFIELGLLLLVGRVLGEAAQRIGQPAVMGMLVGGLVLGPSVFGVLWPQAQHALFPATPEQKSMIDAVAQLGVLLLLLVTGMETDLKMVRRVGRAAVTVSAAGVALPFVCGFMLGEFLPESILPKPEARFITSLFLGTALSISSVKIVAMVVREMNFMRRNIGQIIVASAILEDTIGWIIIAIAFGLASAGTIDLWSVARAMLGTAVFLAASLTVGRRVVFSLIRWTNDNFVSEFPVITMILLIMIGMALTTYLIGVHTVLGAFVAGILVGESPILTRHIDEQLRGLITAVFMPVFFGVSGLSADLTVLSSPDLLLLTAGLILIASVGKFSGAFVGGRLGGLSRPESLALACGMNARGSTEVIVASIGLSMSVLSQNLFTMIVTMAIVTTMIMPPMLRWALARLPFSKEERQRLEREELDSRGFVTNIERLLLAVDESVTGKFAKWLAGIVAGPSGKPITILDMARNDRGRKAAKPKEAAVAANAEPAKAEPSKQETEGAKAKAKESEQEVKAAAESVTTLAEHPDEKKPGSVDVTTRAGGAKGPAAVAEEARKGYGLLVIGVEKMRGSKGGFSPDVTQMADGFEGPLAVVIARGENPAQMVERRSRILIPVNGTDVSRRAAEVAMVVARANDAQVTALYIARTSGSNGKRKRPPHGSATRRSEEAVLKEIVALADRYEVDVRTTLRVNVAPEEAILKEAKRGRYDLIVLGVGRRPGDTLFFGNTAAGVLDHAETSAVFVAS